jgi:hypothetical protein
MLPLFRITILFYILFFRRSLCLIIHLWPALKTGAVLLSHLTLGEIVPEFHRILDTSMSLQILVLSTP